MNLTHIGKYDVIATLGRGSMGLVYKAQDPEIGRLVAIKTLRTLPVDDGGQESEILKRFKLEARSAGKLRHPNIVTIFETGRAEDGSPFIVMEYIQGESLEVVISKRAPVDPHEALHYLAQVASAIDYAHSEQVYHRDIKPSNVIVDRFNIPHLLDFGVAKLSDTSLTPAGTVVGTPSYMSPEQIRGEDTGGGTDLFALAVMMFEIITGVRPFPGKDFVSVVGNIIHNQPIPFSEIGVDYPREVETILHKALSKRREDRFQTGFEMVEKVANAFGIRVDQGGVVGGLSQGLSWHADSKSDEQSTTDLLFADMPGRQEEPGGSDNSGDSDDSADTSCALAQEVFEQSVDGTLNQKRKIKPIEHGAPHRPKFVHIAALFLGMLGIGGIAAFVFGQFLSGPADPGQTTALVSESKSVQQHVAQNVRGSLHEEPEPFSEQKIASSTRFEQEEEEAENPGSVRNKNAQDEHTESKNVDGSNDLSGDLVSNTEGTVAIEEGGDLKVDKSDKLEATEAVDDTSDKVDESESIQLNTDNAPKTERVFDREYLLSLSDWQLNEVLQVRTLTDREALLAVEEIRRRKAPVLTAGLAQISRNGQYRVKIEVLRTIALRPFIQQPEAVEVVNELLSDGDHLVRGYAAETLAATRDRRAILALQERRSQETHPIVLRVINRAIASLRKVNK